MNEQTPKHFVLQLGSLISLYLSVSFLLVLLFGLINLKFPDDAESFWALESAASSVRLGIAMVLVFAPTYFILTRNVNKLRRETSAGSYLGLTKWLIYLSLLIGGGALLIDLVVVIMTFLEGELTQRFFLKAFAVLVVVGAAIHYYLLDAKGFWLKNEQKSIMFGIGAAIIMIVSVAYGFANIETPAQVREIKIDNQQVSDLQQIQWAVQDYVLLNDELPTSLDELSAPTPTAPTERTPYEYNITNEGFSLCATFASASNPEVYPRAIDSLAKENVIVNPDNWQHDTGLVCFERRLGTTPTQ